MELKERKHSGVLILGVKLHHNISVNSYDETEIKRHRRMAIVTIPTSILLLQYCSPNLPIVHSTVPRTCRSSIVLFPEPANHPQYCSLNLPIIHITVPRTCYLPIVLFPELVTCPQYCSPNLPIIHSTVPRACHLPVVVLQSNATIFQSETLKYQSQTHICRIVQTHLIVASLVELFSSCLLFL